MAPLKPVNATQAIDQMLVSLGTSRFDIAVRSAAGKTLHLYQELFLNQVKDMLPALATYNSNGHYIFVRPHGEHGLTLLPRLRNRHLIELHENGFTPVVELQYAHDLYQAWLRHDRKLAPEESQRVAQQLAKMVGINPKRVSWNAYGFLAGLYIHHDDDGKPVAAKPSQLTFSSGESYPEAKRFLDTLLGTT